MAAGDTANTNQHYVPQMLLRGFATARDPEQVWVFHKRDQRSFRTAIRNIGAERGYYDLDGSAALDDAMNRADDLAAPIINRIRTRRSVAGLSEYDRTMLAGFVVLQMLRTRGSQERFRNLSEALADRLIQMNGGVMPVGLEQESTDRQREQYLRMIPEHTRSFLPHLLTKDLLAYRSSPGAPFQISDHPVAMANTLNPGDGIRGTLGLGVVGIEIYMPISNELTLAYMCPSIGRAYDAIAADLWRMGGFVNEAASEYLVARDTGRACRLTPENVRYQNSLQVLNAERFVMSSVNEFADAEDIVARDLDARVGLRVSVM
jgi:hypothetical protein